MHWPGAWPNISSTDPSRLVGMVELLPYQDGSTVPIDSDDRDSTEIVGTTTTAESGTHSTMRHSREVFMAGQPPQITMPTRPTSKMGRRLYPTSLRTLPHLTKKQTSRGWPGRRRIKPDKSTETTPNTERKSGNGSRRLAKKLIDDA